MEKRIDKSNERNLCIVTNKKKGKVGMTLQYTLKNVSLYQNIYN